MFDYFGYRTYANLVEVDISTKPPTWTEQEDKLKDEIPLVKGAKLKGARLQNANMQFAFLINADLREANLQDAILLGANLRDANLARANLQDARWTNANLQKANLWKANLRGASLTYVKNLTQAQLDEACVDENTKLPEGLNRPEPCSEEALSQR